VAARPANQPVQLADHQRMHGTETSPAEWHPTFMFFMGYPTRDAIPSARRGVREVII
jgi:hypothetical protein